MSRNRGSNGAPERLRQLQEGFAAHLREPSLHPAPEGLEDRRLEIYRGLFFRNIRKFLSNNFPVLRKLHSAQGWDRLVRDFYHRHRSATPLFPEIPREFLKYLQDERGEQPGDPPFMLELAHYEWVELALSLDEAEIDEVPADPGGELRTGVPVLSPLAWLLSYRFPVHRIGPACQPTEPPAEATHLLVYRDREDRVRFMQLNPISMLLLQKLKEDPDQTGVETLRRISKELGHPDPAVLETGGLELLEDLRRRDVVLGTRSTC